MLLTTKKAAFSQEAINGILTVLLNCISNCLEDGFWFETSPIRQNSSWILQLYVLIRLIFLTELRVHEELHRHFPSRLFCW